MSVQGHVGGGINVVANAALYAMQQRQAQREAHQQHRAAVATHIVALGAQELARRLQAANSRIASLEAQLRIAHGDGTLEDLDAL